MCQGIQLILNALKVIISALVDGLLADNTPGLLPAGCLLGGDALTVKFLWFLAVEDLEVLPLFHRSQLSWQICLPFGLKFLHHILSSSNPTVNLEMGKDTEHLAAHALTFTIGGLHNALESSDSL